MDFKKYLKELSIGLSVIIFYFVASISHTYGVYWLYDELNWPAELAHAYSIICQLLIIVSIIYVYRHELRDNLNHFRKNAESAFKNCAKYLFLSYGLVALSNTLVRMIADNNIAQNEEAIRALSGSFPLYSIIIVILFAPVIEELIFRFSIRKLFGNLTWVYIICSGLIFGLLHVFSGNDYIYLISYSIPGCIFAYAYVKEKNIIVPIILHAINNSVGIAVIAWFTFFGLL